MVDSKAIGKRIKALRKAKGLTQAQLAEVLNIFPGGIYKRTDGARDRGIVRAVE